jgi:hypothetical protein
VQAREQAVSVTKLATSVASIKIPARSLTVVCYCSSIVIGRVILFRCGETFARKLVILRDESRRLENGTTHMRFDSLIGLSNFGAENGQII